MRESPLFWRSMRRGDLPRVEQIGDRIHTGYPEDTAVFSERLQLCPAGCFVLEDADGIAGYGVGHPWLLGKPPPLNTLLHSLPIHADTFYIHDVALMGAVRGTGLGTQAVALLADAARQQRLDTMSLVAVSGSLPFWATNGFNIVEQHAIRAQLTTYGADAAYMVRRLV